MMNEHTEHHPAFYLIWLAPLGAALYALVLLGQEMSLCGQQRCQEVADSGMSGQLANAVYGFLGALAIAVLLTGVHWYAAHPGRWRVAGAVGAAAGTYSVLHHAHERHVRHDARIFAEELHHHGIDLVDLDALGHYGHHGHHH